MKTRFYLNKFLLCSIFWCGVLYINAQDNNNDFVQYRMQYKSIKWQQYSNKKYDLFYSNNADTLARYIVENTNTIMQAIEDTTLLEFEGKINIVSYNSTAELQQSNIGQFFEKMKLSNAIPFNNNRIVLAYNGSKDLLLQDLHKALCHYIYQTNFYGTQLQEVIKNITNTNLPSWFNNGVPAYYHMHWRVVNDNIFKGLLMVPKPKTFEDLAMQNPSITGNAFLYYLSQKFGTPSVNNFIFMIKQNKDVALSASLIYKKPLWWLQQNSLVFFANRYLADNAQCDIIETDSVETRFSKPLLNSKNSSFIPITACLHASGKLMAIIRQTESYNNVEIVNMNLKNKQKKQHTILKISKISNQQIDNPLLHWRAGSNLLGCIYNQAGILKCNVFVVADNGKVVQTIAKNIPELDGVSSFVFSNQANTILLTGSVAGQQDIFSYNYQSNKLIQITDDYYDEDKISYYKFGDKEGILFLGNNSIDTIYNISNFIHKRVSKKLYFVDKMQLNMLTNQVPTYIVPQVIDSAPIALTIQSIQQGLDGAIQIITNQNGSNQLYYYSLDNNKWDAKCYPLTNLPCNILSANYSQENKKWSAICLLGDSIIKVNCSANIKNNLLATSYRLDEEIQKFYLQPITTQKKLGNNNENKSIVMQLFTANDNEQKSYQDTIAMESIFRNKKFKPYQLQLSSEYAIACIDNAILANQYQPFSAQQGLFHQPNLSAIGKYNFTNLFEDYKLQLGFRLPSNGKGSDYFILFNNYKKLNDWSISYFRHAEKFTLSNPRNWITPAAPIQTPSFIKQITHYLQYTITHPISLHQGIDAAIAMRYNKQIFLAIDKFSLMYPDTFQLWCLAKINCQYTNIRYKMMNIKNGYDFKTFIEYQFQLAKKQIGFVHTGISGKYYLPLFKNVVWANQITLATSIGSGNNGIMYSLGGINNWIAPLADSSIQFNSADNYAFVSSTSQLRSFAIHIRNGNTICLLNSEIRLPLLNTFMPITTKYQPVNNLQLLVFVDAGNAWKTIEKIDNNNFAIGYGLGARTSLLNYFVKLDCGWRNQNQAGSKSPLLMVSLGTDF